MDVTRNYEQDLEGLNINWEGERIRKTTRVFSEWVCVRNESPRVNATVLTHGTHRESLTARRRTRAPCRAATGTWDSTGHSSSAAHFPPFLFFRLMHRLQCLGDESTRHDHVDKYCKVSECDGSDLCLGTVASNAMVSMVADQRTRYLCSPDGG